MMVLAGKMVYIWQILKKSNEVNYYESQTLNKHLKDSTLQAPLCLTQVVRNRNKVTLASQLYCLKERIILSNHAGILLGKYKYWGGRPRDELLKGSLLQRKMRLGLRSWIVFLIRTFEYSQCSFLMFDIWLELDICETDN